MKQALIKMLSLLMASLMILSTLAACGVSDENKQGDEDGSGNEAVSESGTTGEAVAALEALGQIDYGGKDFVILYSEQYKNEIWGENKVVDKEGGADQVINDAVYERNVTLEESCKLKFGHLPKPVDAMNTTITNEAATATGDFQLITHSARATASTATSGYLRDYISMGVDLDYTWWDSGTADFVLEGQVFFMNGALNFYDDNVTYVLIFNKEMQKQFANTVPDPYETVLNWDWTLDYFNQVIQGVSADNGDGKWDEKDTYGFLTTWEYGNTFFMGSDLRYVINSGTEDPELFLDDGKMEKATNVLELACAIYHDNNASFMSPPGEEAKGFDAFKDGRGLFFGEVAQNLPALNREMTGDYGVLPVPKYDKAQEFYRTWTHDSGSTLSVTSAVRDDDAEVVGDIIEAYAILSYLHVKPAYYDTMLASKSLRDPQSPVMLDLIFQNRVYDMAMYFDLGFYQLFKTAVNDNSGSFSSSYTKTAKRFDKQMDRILEKLKNDKS
ncbi:MAG: hypothetical protein E7661_06465 [Ruminococcaceae bacterium]|nr:hypothetical protein [Oscillospiraceae bacterium]